MGIKLNDVVRVGPDSRVAFVGAGGKTTAMFQLAHQIEGPCIVTTSTHLGLSQAEFSDRHIIVEDQFPETFLPGVNLLTGPSLGNRWGGLDDDQLEKLHLLAKNLNVPILIEADGSRQRPLKAPAKHEPALPPFINILVVMAGLAGVGQPLDERLTHRPELFSDLSGIALGDVVTPDGLARILVHPAGGLKMSGLKEPPRKIVVLNQADDETAAALGAQIARLVLPDYDDVIISGLAANKIWGVYKPTAGVILAGGKSERLGEPKQLLQWRGESFVRVAAKTALAAGLHPVVVVTGAHHEKVVPEIEDLPVQIVHNRDWAEGQSTSVVAGVGALPPHIGGAVFMVTDQPQTPFQLIQALVSERVTSLAPVVVPMADGRRTTPVLFGSETFEDMRSLTGDAGGRALFSKYPLAYVPWVNAVVALDVDTMEDYSRLLNYEND